MTRTTFPLPGLLRDQLQGAQQAAHDAAVQARATILERLGSDQLVALDRLVEAERTEAKARLMLALDAEARA